MKLDRMYLLHLAALSDPILALPVPILPALPNEVRSVKLISHGDDSVAMKRSKYLLAVADQDVTGEGMRPTTNTKPTLAPDIASLGLDNMAKMIPFIPGTTNISTASETTKLYSDTRVEQGAAKWPPANYSLWEVVVTIPMVPIVYMIATITGEQTVLASAVFSAAIYEQIARDVRTSWFLILAVAGAHTFFHKAYCYHRMKGLGYGEGYIAVTLGIALSVIVTLLSVTELRRIVDIATGLSWAPYLAIVHLATVFMTSTIVNSWRHPPSYRLEASGDDVSRDARSSATSDLATSARQ